MISTVASGAAGTGAGAAIPLVGAALSSAPAFFNSAPHSSANALTGGLQQQFTNQVLKPLAQLRQTDPAAAAQQMGPLWAKFQQQVQQWASGDPSGIAARVANQMYSTPGFINTVASILGSMPQVAKVTGGTLASLGQQQQAGPTAGAQFPTTTLPTTSALSETPPPTAGGPGGSGGQWQTTAPGWINTAIHIGEKVFGKHPATTPATGGGTGGGAAAPPAADPGGWQQILPYLVGGGLSIGGGLLSNAAAQQRNNALQARSGQMDALANDARRNQNVYSAAAFPSILQGLGNRNPNMVQQANTQMNGAKFPTGQ